MIYWGDTMIKVDKAKVIFMILIIVQLLNSPTIFSENDILTQDEREFIN